MKAWVINCLLLSIIPFYSRAQVAQPAGKLDVNTAPGGIISEIKSERPPVRGSNYLHEDWQTGIIRLKSGDALDSVSFKYGLDGNRFELKNNDEITMLDGSQVFSFFWQGVLDSKITQYVNCDGYLLDQTPLLGFYEVLVASDAGGVGLFSKMDLRLKKSYYVPALDVGEKADTYTKSESLFLVTGITVYKLPKSGDAFWKFFKGNAPNMKFWAKQNKIKWKQKEDLIRILNHYNLLASGAEK